MGFNLYEFPVMLFFLTNENDKDLHEKFEKSSCPIFDFALNDFFEYVDSNKKSIEDTGSTGSSGRTMELTISSSIVMRVFTF